MGITTLLSMTVFMMLVAENMPPTSNVLPLIGNSASLISLMNHHACSFMLHFIFDISWLRYQTVINLETQVGIISQRNK
jgi:hypothetical protein